MKTLGRIVVVVSSCALAACGGFVSTGQSTSTAGQDLTAHNGDGVNGDGVNGDGVNGDGVNGDGVNGDELNGRNIDGTSLGKAIQSVHLASASLMGSPLDDVALNGSELTGTLAGAPLSGHAFDGVHFTGTTDNGSTVDMRVESVSRDPAPNEDIWSYEVSYQDPSSGAWYPICPDESDVNQLAVPILGYWSYAFGTPGGGGKTESTTDFTFACRVIGALGKCVDFGYAPWRTHGGVSLDAYHQACVRMVRADFCGNGISYTHDGNLIDLYDDIGIQSDTEDWPIEAEWTPDGAACFTEPNRGHTIGIDAVPCYDATQASTCGDLDHFQSGTLLMDEFQQ